MKRLIPLVVLALCTGTAAAQVDTSPQGRIGRHPFGAYFDSNIDTVDLYNGNLMLNITLFTMPGRELSHGLHLSYNARKWVPSPNGLYGFYTGGWRIANAAGWAGVDMLLVDCYGPFYEYGVWNISGWWRDGLGVTRKYYGDPIEGECNQSSPPSGENLYLYPEAQDGSLLTTGSWSEEIRLYFRDGSMLDLSTGNARTVTANGNYLEPGVADGLVGQDTLGRTITYSTNRGANTTPLCDFTPTDPIPYYKTFTITDSSGNQQTYTLNFEKNHFTFNPIEQCWEHLDDWLNSIVLPNGKKYEFRYDNFQGYLTQVKLPSGATIDYDYAGGHQSHTYGDDWVTARHVSLDGGATLQTWTYARDTNNPARTVTVTSPETMQGTNPVTHQVAHTFNSSGQETQTDYYNDANESPLQTVTTTWTGRQADTGRYRYRIGEAADDDAVVVGCLPVRYATR